MALFHSYFNVWLFNIAVVVQFYPWFKFSFLLFQTHYHVIIIHYHTQKQKKRKFEPRIKLNHNIAKPKSRALAWDWLKSTKRDSCWCAKPVLWELSSLLISDAIFCSNKFHRRSCDWNRSIRREHRTHFKPLWKSISLEFGFSQECHSSLQVRCQQAHKNKKQSPFSLLHQ